MRFEQKLAALIVGVILLISSVAIVAAVVSSAFRLEGATIVGVIITQLVLLAGGVLGLAGSRDARRKDDDKDDDER